MKEIQCKQGEWTVLTRSNAARMPAHYNVSLSGENPSGEYRVYRGFLPFGLGISLSERGDLKLKMEFSRNWSDASFRVEINPNQDLVAQIS